MQVDRDVFVPMRDGVHIALDVFRPDGPGRVPAILTRTPYLKGAPPTPEEEAAGSPRLRTVQTLTDAGYAVVVSDTRGTGWSEGVYDYYNFEHGPLDGYDTVEWIAEQSWCDGIVGMTGASAAAILAFEAAVDRPPSLKTIVANMHPADFYFDQWFVGGVFRHESRIGWCTNMLPRINPIPPTGRDDPAFERKRDVYQARIAQQHARIAAGRNAMNLDWLTEMYQRNTYDDFWRSISFEPHLEDFHLPVLHGGVWYDHFLRGTLNSHAGVPTQKRLFVSPGGLIGSRGAGDGGFEDLQVRWFDHFLRGAENGVTAEPGVRIYLVGAEQWVDLSEWPPPSRDLQLLLRSEKGGADSSFDGGLSEGGGSAGEAILVHDPEAPNRTPRNPLDHRRFEARCATFSTAPLDRPLTVAGSPRLRLSAESDAADVDWCVRLCDVFPDGRSRLLNTGALKASHVASHESPEPLQAGRVYEFDIEIWAVANRFEAGHRIRVDISTSDFPFFESNPLQSRNRILFGGEHPSCLTLPVADLP